MTHRAEIWSYKPPKVDLEMDPRSNVNQGNANEDHVHSTGIEPDQFHRTEGRDTRRDRLLSAYGRYIPEGSSTDAEARESQVALCVNESVQEELSNELSRDEAVPAQARSASDVELREACILLLNTIRIKMGCVLDSENRVIGYQTGCALRALDLLIYPPKTQQE